MGIRLLGMTCDRRVMAPTKLLSPVALTVFALGAAADARSTWLCLMTPGLNEANPITVGLSQHFGLLTTLIATKVAAAGIALGVCILLGRRFPKTIYPPRLASMLLISLGGIFTCIGIHNFILFSRFH